MPRRQYQESLEELGEDVRGMGDLVLERLDRALVALDSGDVDCAERVLDGDDEIDRRYLELEGDCIDLFALQQPVAGDLRFVAGSFKILTDIERVGDLATNLAGYAIEGIRDGRGGGPGRTPAGVDPEVVTIGTDARALFADALDAYAADDAEAARSVAARDDEIDALCASAGDRLARDLLECEADDDPWNVERLLEDVSRSLLTLREVERVADHGVNVAARTLYAVESDPGLI
jgi:phosphate transport system protein